MSNLIAIFETSDNNSGNGTVTYWFNVSLNVSNEVYRMTLGVVEGVDFDQPVIVDKYSECIDDSWYLPYVSGLIGFVTDEIRAEAKPEKSNFQNRVV